jgi:hypothetical protein
MRRILGAIAVCVLCASCSSTAPAVTTTPVASPTSAAMFGTAREAPPPNDAPSGFTIQSPH